MCRDADDFEAHWYLHKRGIVDQARLARLYDYAVTCARKRTLLRSDSQVPNALFAHGDPEFDQLLEDLRERVELISNRSLWPTFSYFRIYERGNLLRAHQDRPACEISVTLNVGTVGDELWPIWIAGPTGMRSVTLRPGDGLVYRGCDCFHWREPFEGERQVQVFLHYVDRNGPSAGWKFDKRQRLACT